MNGITTKQKQVLNSIIEFKSNHGYSPTVRELCEMTGLKSTSSIASHMRTLKENGYITWIDSMPRTIQVLKVA